MIPRGLGADFGRLWVGESVSLVGTQISTLALPLLAVYLLHSGPVALGLLGTAAWLPYVLFALVAGVYGDRVRRRRVLIGADVVRAAIMTTVVVLGVLHLLSLALLLGLAFVIGIGNVVFEVFYYSYVPALVPPAELLRANSRLQVSESAAAVAGPGLAGLLVQVASAPIALMADAASFLWSGFMLSRIRRPERPPDAAAQGGLVSQMRAGLGLTWRNRVLLTLVATAAICNLTAQWSVVLFPLFGVRTLGLSTGLVGLAVSSGAIGSLLGSTVCGRMTRKIGVGYTTMWTLLGQCLGFLLLPATPARSIFTIPVLIAGWIVIGFNSAVSRIVSISIRQASTPPEYLGRVNASHRFVSYGVIAIGTAVGGLLADALGIRAAMAIAAMIMFASVGCVLVSPLLSPRRHGDTAPAVRPG